MINLKPIRYNPRFRCYEAAFDCNGVHGDITQLLNGHVVVSCPGHNEVAAESTLALGRRERRALFIQCINETVD